MRIDTSTTEGKIAVMHAYTAGEKIQTIYRGDILWWNNDAPDWNWEKCDYRIKPQTLEEAAVALATKEYPGTPKTNWMAFVIQGVVVLFCSFIFAILWSFGRVLALIGG